MKMLRLGSYCALAPSARAARSTRSVSPDSVVPLSDSAAPAARALQQTTYAFIDGRAPLPLAKERAIKAARAMAR